MMTDYTDLIERLENFGYGTTNPEVTKRAGEAIKMLIAERDAEIVRNRPLLNLITSLEEQKSQWNQQRNDYREAVATLDGEREANAKLTAERDELLDTLERIGAWLENRNLGGLMPLERELIVRAKGGA